MTAATRPSCTSTSKRCAASRTLTEALGRRACTTRSRGRDANALHAPAHLPAGLELILEARPGSEHLADLLEDGRRFGLLAQVSLRAGPKLAEPVQKVLLPGKEHHRYVGQHRVLGEGPAQAEPVEPRHEDVAEHHVRKVPPDAVEGVEAIGGLEYFRPGLLEEAGEEPAHGGVVVGDECAPSREGDRKRVLRLRPARETHERRTTLARCITEANATGGSVGDLGPRGGDGRPGRRKQLGPVAQGHAQRLALGGRIDETAPDLEREAVGDFLDGDVAEALAPGVVGHPCEAPSEPVQGFGRRRLLKDGVHARLTEARLVGRPRDLMQSDHGHPLGQLIGPEAPRKIAVFDQLDVGEDDVRRAGARLEETGLDVVGDEELVAAFRQRRAQMRCRAFVIDDEHRHHRRERVRRRSRDGRNAAEVPPRASALRPPADAPELRRRGDRQARSPRGLGARVLGRRRRGHGPSRRLGRGRRTHGRLGRRRRRSRRAAGRAGLRGSRRDALGRGGATPSARGRAATRDENGAGASPPPRRPVPPRTAPETRARTAPPPAGSGTNRAPAAANWRAAPAGSAGGHFGRGRGRRGRRGR